MTDIVIQNTLEKCDVRSQVHRTAQLIYYYGKTGVSWETALFVAKHLDHCKLIVPEGVLTL